MKYLYLLPLLIASAYAGDAAKMDQDEMLNLHNNYRRQVKASNMQKLRWDFNLGRSAQARANRCKFEHTDLNVRMQGNYGENLATGTDYHLAKESISQLATRMWFAENQTCGGCKQNSGCCGHFSQMVWANTNRLGCGSAYCPNGVAAAGSSAINYLLVCQYSPPGNFPGQDAYQYENGKVCAQCRNNCDNGLCT